MTDEREQALTVGCGDSSECLDRTQCEIEGCCVRLLTATAAARERARPVDARPAAPKLTALLFDLANWDRVPGYAKLCEQAAAALLAQQQRIEGYQASRDYAIDLLAGALGVEPDKVRAVEYYARLACEALAAARRVPEIAGARYRELRRMAVVGTPGDPNIHCRVCGWAWTREAPEAHEAACIAAPPAGAEGAG